MPPGDAAPTGFFHRDLFPIDPRAVGAVQWLWGGPKRGDTCVIECIAG
jgi:hypothetical protein